MCIEVGERAGTGSAWSFNSALDRYLGAQMTHLALHAVVRGQEAPMHLDLQGGGGWARWVGMVVTLGPLYHLPSKRATSSSRT